MCSSLLRDEVEVEPEVLQHVAQVDRRVRPVAADLLVCEFAGLLEGGILEIGVEFEFVFHDSSIPRLDGTLHRLDAPDADLLAPVDEEVRAKGLAGIALVEPVDHGVTAADHVPVTNRVPVDDELLHGSTLSFSELTLHSDRAFGTLGARPLEGDVRTRLGVLHLPVEEVRVREVRPALPAVPGGIRGAVELSATTLEDVFLLRGFQVESHGLVIPHPGLTLHSAPTLFSFVVLDLRQSFQDVSSTNDGNCVHGPTLSLLS